MPNLITEEGGGLKTNKKFEVCTEVRLMVRAIKLISRDIFL